MAWAKVEQPEPVNFTDIVSEEISKKLEAKKKTIDSEQETDNENNKEAQVILDNLKSISEDTCENDAIIARMLQMHLNKENDFDEDKAEIIDSPSRKVYDRSLSFDSEFEPESDHVLPSQLSSNILDDFNIYSNPKQARSYKFDNKKDQDIAEVCTDKFVNTILHKLITCRLLKSVGGIISNTKRAIIYSARLNLKSPDLTGLSDLPKECAVKIYKSDLSDFKQWDKYSKKDPHFKAKINKGSSEASEREMANFVKIHNANFPAWTTDREFTCFARGIILKHGALIMSLIGENQKPAPTLNHAVMTKDEYHQAYRALSAIIVRLYANASLVHSDLSEHNILWHNKSCYFVSIGQCVDRYDKRTADYIRQACNRMNTFFKTKGVAVQDTQSLFSNTYFWCTYKY